jgi:hypothetical protein
MELPPVICTHGLSAIVIEFKFPKLHNVQISLRSVKLFLDNVNTSNDVGK